MDFEGAFRKLTEAERRAVLEGAEQVQYAPGEVIVEAGTANTGLYVVRKGEVRVQQRVRVARRNATTEGKNAVEGVLEMELARLGEGAVFGEMSFLDGLGASATVSAVTPVSAARVTRAAIDRWVEKDPMFATRLFESLAITLALRLRSANRRIAGG